MNPWVPRLGHDFRRRTGVDEQPVHAGKPLVRRAFVADQVA
ncbi:MAG TPA: hypothetical protein VFR32_10765 [Gaiellaceae bacterium]|nr:hypothetical protein [Gaiellaceae bacterium]